jgi:threonine dehydrogenase-like Zn-dependent dehydrogenase
VKPGDRVLIVGAGPIGVGTAIFARATGADVTLVDVSERRLGYLSDKLGFTQSIRAGENSVAEASRATDGDLFDVVYDATGNARAMEHSFSFVAHGGTLVFVGVLKADITFSDGDFHRREMTLKATRNATRADFETVVRAIGGGLIPMDSINTHGAMLEDLPRAMPDWIALREHPLKAVLTV